MASPTPSNRTYVTTEESIWESLHGKFSTREGNFLLAQKNRQYFCFVSVLETRNDLIMKLFLLSFVSDIHEHESLRTRRSFKTGKGCFDNRKESFETGKESFVTGNRTLVSDLQEYETVCTRHRKLCTVKK